MFPSFFSLGEPEFLGQHQKRASSEKKVKKKEVKKEGAGCLEGTGPNSIVQWAAMVGGRAAVYPLYHSESLDPSAFSGNDVPARRKQEEKTRDHEETSPRVNVGVVLVQDLDSV